MGKFLNGHINSSMGQYKFLNDFVMGEYKWVNQRMGISMVNFEHLMGVS